MTTEDDLRSLAHRLVGSDTDHLALAVAATKLAEAATRVARSEVMAARSGGTTWAEVGAAFGITTQTAHERFRSGPDGLHSRYDQRQPSSRDGGRTRRVRD